MSGLTILGVAVAAITGVIFWKQLGVMSDQLAEMKSGGKDTHDLAVAAGKQADDTKALADQAKAQVDKMAESVAKTDSLIKETTKQANSTAELAREAKRSADIADSELKHNKTALDATVGQNREALKATLDQGQKALNTSIDAQLLDQRPWVGLFGVNTIGGKAIDEQLTEGRVVAI